MSVNPVVTLVLGAPLTGVNARAFEFARDRVREPLKVLKE